MTGRLARTQSPYLRAHADNPVDWWPWGADAFAEAKRRDVPLLISIGYSTCHWCHVMARESFADEGIAALINEWFVPVKVDREEHPEVDGAMMAAASAFTRNLGWPLNVFATPAGRVFFAGTYWPPEARAPLPAFATVLRAVHEAWTERRDEVVQSADAVADALAQAAAEEPGDLPSTHRLVAAAHEIAAREDRLFGGFGDAPKFPVATTLEFLLTPLVRAEAPDAAAAATRALSAMAASALRDDIDGGFFRYATGRDWTVPHYERMLTDNAQLLDVARRAGDEQTARGVAGFLLGTLRLPGGGFGAAQDSESVIDGQRSEGGYYRATAAERASLAPPAVDGKVITGWNGLAIGALARAGVTFGEPEWVQAAQDAARYVLATNRDAAGGLVRTSLGGTAAAATATLADYALLAEGLFALALATGEARWAVTARELLDTALDDGVAADPVLVAEGIALSPDNSDGDLPSGPSALALAALAAWQLGAGERYRQQAEALCASGGVRALAQPFAHGGLLRAAAGLATPPRQLVVVTDNPDGPLAQAARAADTDVTGILTPAQAQAFAAAGFALFDGKTDAAAYDCRAFTCRLPTNDPADITAAR